MYGQRLPRRRLGARRPPRDHDVVTHNEDWAACAASVDPELMEATFAELAADLAPACRRRDLRANSLCYLRGLLMPQVAAIDTAAHPAPILHEDPDQLPPADCGTIALTVPEAQRLFHLLTTLTRNLLPHTARARIARHLNWSGWRRRHQARARWHHYRTRLALIA